MRRAWILSALLVSLGACAGKEAPSGDGAVAKGPEVSKETRVERGDKEERKGQAEAGECESLLRADDVSIQHRGQGSHGAATTDVTLDLATGRLRGKGYRLDDSGTPVPLSVDQEVSPEVLGALRELLGSICAPREVVESQEHAAPGGSTQLEIKHADGTSLLVVIGASNLPAGAIVARPSRDEWTQIFELWPEAEGK